MAPPSSNNGKPHFSPLPHPKSITNQTNSNSNSNSLLLFKLILCSLFLLALPFFSTRPPQTQQSNLLNHLWELLHLLFIGIAVSYGLFSRKNASFPISESSSQLDHSLSDWSNMLLPSPEETRPDGFQNPCGYGETNVIQAWNSQYNHTRSLVVVADAYKSLGLPVRSLKSALSSDRRRNRKFGDLGPTQFNENDEALPSPISWRSRSGRMEIAEKNSAAPIRPLSVDETQFESLKPRPFHFHSKAPSFSQTSSKMEDLRYKKMEASFATAAAHSNSVSFEFLSNSKMEDLRYNKMEMRDEMDNATSTTHAHLRPPSVDETECESHNSESFQSEASYATSLYSSSSSNNHSPLHSNSSELPESNIQEQFESFKSRPFQSKPSYSPSHSEECSNGTLSERDLSGSEREFVSRNKERFLNSVKPARKPPLRGKSVRTIRSHSKTADARNSREGFRNCVPNPTFQRNQIPNVESEEEVEESRDGKFRESSEEVEEEIVCKIESDGRGEHDEVDKKASEFIAKFREQIRLQKSASVDISGELNINDDYFR